MHELSLAQSLVEIVENEADKNNASKVTSVTVLIGEMSGVEVDAFTFCYPEATRNTILENSKLVIKEEALQVKCKTCNKLSNPEIFYLVCGHCESNDVEVVSGKDFKLLSLDIE